MKDIFGNKIKESKNYVIKKSKKYVKQEKIKESDDNRPSEEWFDKEAKRLGVERKIPQKVNKKLWHWLFNNQRNGIF